MRNGFTFKGRHSSEFGVAVRTKSRPVHPAPKSFTVDMPCRDGVYDFSAANPLGREVYNDRIFIVTIGAAAENLGELQKKITRLSKWLTGSGTIIFDELRLIEWHGKISDEIIYMPENNGTKAVMEVSFRVKPFGFCVFGTEGPEIDAEEIILDENLPIGFDEIFTFSVSGSGDLRIINFGDRPARPVIGITNGEDIRLSMGDKSLSFSADSDVFVDFERRNVICGGESVGVSGDFFEFGEGTGVLHIENSNTEEMTITVSYIPEFMYGVYFDDVEWGVDDA